MEYSPANIKRGKGMNGGNAVFNLKWIFHHILSGLV